ncbi:hypothetical protein Tco_1561499 [Tanacetum coccineum]
MDAGICPEILFSDKKSQLSLLTLPIFSGSSQEILFRDKSRQRKLEDSNRLGGIDPVSLLSERNIASMDFRWEFGLKFHKKALRYVLDYILDQS